MNRFHERVNYVLKHNVTLNKVFRFFASRAIQFIGLFVKTDDHSILFSAHNHKYNDSPRVIYEYMIKNDKYAHFKFFWAVKSFEKDLIPGKFVQIRPDTFKYFVVALRCKYWIASVNIERSLKFKPKKCIYLNTWHGIPIKTVGNEAVGRKDYDFSYIDFFCISSEYETEIYKRSFNISGSQLLKSGLPRNETLYKNTIEDTSLIKKRLGLPLDKKILLYAPTWRDSTNGGKSYTIKPPINFYMWEQRLGDKFVVLLRTHPYTNDLMGDIHFNKFLIDCTKHPDINDILKISDFLISDYSATIFDYAILERPIICFAYDFDQYSKDRGFVMDVKKEMPNGIFYDEEEIISFLLKCNYEEESKKVQTFKNKYITYGGSAIETCVSAIMKGE